MKDKVRFRALIAAAALPAAAVAALWLVNGLFPFPAGKLAAGREPTVIRSHDGAVLRFFVPDENRFAIPRRLDHFPPALLEATVAVEDKRFYRHCGIDPLAVLRAALSNIRQRRIVSGASTITMQTVRLLTPRPRTLRSKIIEAFRALQLERILTKRQILELYLNRAPYGGALYGAEAASYRYFGKPASRLTVPEAALLAGLPKSPSGLRPDRYPQRARQRRNLVLQRMEQERCLSRRDYVLAVKTPLRAGSHPFPFAAPHLAEHLNHRAAAGTDLRSSLDLGLQKTARDAVTAAVGELREGGVTNGAVCIIENSTGFVRALVGSVDFNSRADDGQVNGAVAVRSPGSALKPFTYALALDRGVVSPTEILADVPIAFRGYVPRNYDRTYHGPVSLGVALRCSLNVPAIELLNRTGLDELYQLLLDAGIGTLDHPPEYYGLGLTLGSCGVTLLELTDACASLARLGEYRPHRFVVADPAPEPTRILSPAAAWLVTDMLARENRRSPTKRRVPAALKTGTSYGHKDAWCIGWNPDYTVGVWVGNFNGLPSGVLVGRVAAEPAVRRIFDDLYRGRKAPWYPKPASVRSRPVCSRSGKPASEHCPQTMAGHYIPGTSPCRPCDVHTRVMVDSSIGWRLCPACAGSAPYTWKTVETWPPEISSFLRRSGRLLTADLPHNPACRLHPGTPRQPAIVSPRDGQEFLLDAPSGSRRQRLLLQAAMAPDSYHAYWFVDGIFLARANAGRKVFWPISAGTHRIVCADDLGRRAAATITIRGKP